MCLVGSGLKNFKLDTIKSIGGLTIKLEINELVITSNILNY